MIEIILTLNFMAYSPTYVCYTFYLYTFSFLRFFSFLLSSHTLRFWCCRLCLAPRQCWIEKIELWSGCRRRRRVANSFFEGIFQHCCTMPACNFQFGFSQIFSTNYYWWAHSAEGHNRGVGIGLRPFTRAGIRLEASGANAFCACRSEYKISKW